MKSFKRLISALVAGTMMICSFAIPTFACEAEENEMLNIAEVVNVEYGENGETITTYEMEITPEMAADGDYGIMPLADIDQTFTMTTSHRGADRTYSGNYLKYSVTVTDSNGNAVANTISVQLKDYNHSYPLVDSRVDADGSTNTFSKISITPGRVYYFYYVLTSGTTRTLRVRMQITSYS